MWYLIVSIPDLCTLTYFDADSAKDSKGNIVQLTYTVHLEIGISYTMNLYYTKCTILINGKATMVFIDEHLIHIHQITSSVTITGVTVDTKTLN